MIAQIFKSGNHHINIVDKAQTLQVNNKKLTKENILLESDVTKLAKIVSSTKEKIVEIQTIEVIKKEKVFIHDTIIIHDTITIKEIKNFWGKTKSDTL